MRMRTPLIVGALLAGVVTLTFSIIPGKSRLIIKSSEVHFPSVSGFNLDRKELEFPRDFAGKLNIVFVAFQQRHQTIINTWVPFAQDAELSYPGIIYYELPTIDEMSSMSRMFINEGMRAGIPDQTSRERTVTLYIKTADFMRATAISDKQDVHILLVDRQGHIIWRSTGEYTAEKGQTLLDVIEGRG